VAEATLRAARDGRAGETYHISTERIVSIRELVEMICRRMGASFDGSVEVVGDRLAKDAAYRLDSAKIRSELNWADSISLEHGIDETISWVERNLETLRGQPMNYVHRP
jgi:dTDP-glucose 4,6-dehydratase